MEILALVVGLVALALSGMNWLRANEQQKANEAFSLLLSGVRARIEKGENERAAEKNTWLQQNQQGYGGN